MRRSNCAAAGISSHKAQNFVLLCTLLSHHLIFFFEDWKKKEKRKSDCFLVRGYKNKKTGWRGAKENSYMSLIVKKKLAAGHGSFNTDSIQNKHCHCWHGDMCCLRRSANLTNPPTLPCFRTPSLSFSLGSFISCTTQPFSSLSLDPLLIFQVSHVKSRSLCLRWLDC